MWIGEYGWFGDPPASAEKLARFAAKEDSLRTAGDAWWQWRQACGDPHSVGKPGGTPDPILIHFRRNGCPGDHDLGIVPEWKCASRPYATAAPGQVTVAEADCTNHFTLTAHTDQSGRVEVWFPETGTGRPEVHGDHDIRQHHPDPRHEPAPYRRSERVRAPRTPQDPEARRRARLRCPSQPAFIYRRYGGKGTPERERQPGWPNWRSFTAHTAEKERRNGRGGRARRRWPVAAQAHVQPQPDRRSARSPKRNICEM
jgi:hypothetical protein